MSVTAVASTTGNAGTVNSGGTFAVTKPSGVQAGDLLVILIGAGATGSAPSLSVDKPFTVRRQNWDNVSGIGTHLLTRIADGTEGSSLTVTVSGNSLTHTLWGCVAYRGVDATAEFLGVSNDYKTNGGTTSSATADTVTISPAHNAVSLISVLSQKIISTPTVTWPSGWNSTDGFLINDGSLYLSFGANLTTQEAATSLASKSVSLGGAAPTVANQYGIGASPTLARISQETVEPLIQAASASTNARVSQEAVEPLISASSANTKARASQIAVEVLRTVRTFTLGAAGETDQAQTLSGNLVPPGVTITPAAETDAAQALTRSWLLTPASETDVAARLIDWVVIGAAGEADIAIQFHYAALGVWMTQVAIEVTGSEESEAQLTQAFLEVLHPYGQNLHIWRRF